MNRVLGAVLFFEVGRREQRIDIPLPSGQELTAEVLDRAVASQLDALESKGVRLADALLRVELVVPSQVNSRLTSAERVTMRAHWSRGPVRSSGYGQVVMHVIPLEQGEPRAVLHIAHPGMQLAVLWLVAAAIFLTFRMRFINIRAFWHAIDITKGTFDRPQDSGEVTHFQALAAALSATVGMGNIAGVATAIAVGGPGATFWMVIAGLLGMTSKMTECTLGLKYREVRADGRIMGGAMYYLSHGLARRGWPRLGRTLAVLFCLMCIGGSFAGGNAYQVNQSLDAIRHVIPVFDRHTWLYGALLTALAAVVILGGIRRIAATADKIVPLMCGIYLLAGLFIIALHAAEIPAAVASIFAGAFTPQAGYGGMLGVLVVGFRRAAFSNEAGVGSAAIAHAAARTPYPVREGIVSLLEPFIDTVVVCTVTALVIVVTRAYDVTHPTFGPAAAAGGGAALTSLAMGRSISWFPYVFCVSVFLFAYSTLISWSYYGERCWAYVFGDGTSWLYRLLFLTFTFLGAIVSATEALEFGDLMILGMAFPNLVGVLLLSGEVRADLADYWSRYQKGEFKTGDLRPPLAG